MSVATFLTNEQLWQEMGARIKAAHHVDAAIAYFGQGGASLLRLGRGDRLIVDMSLAAVRAGATDPREVEKLIRRGVQAFTRRNLHAKTVVTDKFVISGSANVSKRSQDVLDEAAIMTNDRAAMRRARDFIDRLCTEPVRPEYLEQCKRHYQPPRFNSQPGSRKQRHHRTGCAKLWIVNLEEYGVPEAEIKRYEQGEAAAEKLIRDGARTSTDSFHYASKPNMANEVEQGDWVIQVVTYDDKSVLVYPPGQILLIDHYVRSGASGKERWVFHLEIPKQGESMPWKGFCRKANSFLRTRNLKSPRTTPVRDVMVADRFLALWTPSGRLALKKK